MKKLEPILANLNICQIVSVDDDYKMDIKKEIANVEISSYYNLIKFSKEELDFLYDSGIQFIHELTEEEIEEQIFRKINLFHLENKEEPLKWLHDVVNEINCQRIEYVKIAELEEIDNLVEKNTLWILDKDMGKIDAIFNTISRIKNKFDAYTNIFLVYTHDKNFEDNNANWDTRAAYLSRIGFDKDVAEELAYEFYVFSKTSNSKPVKADFKEIVLKSILGYTIKCVLNDMKEVKKKVQEEFIQITKDTSFTQMATIRYNLENEGEQNIYKIIQNIEHLMELQYYKDYISEERNMIAVFRNVISNTKSKGSITNFVG